MLNDDRMSGVGVCIQHPLTPNQFPAIGGRTAMADTHSTCRKCHRVLPNESFSKSKLLKSDGSGYCRECCALTQRANGPQRRASDRIRRRLGLAKPSPKPLGYKEPAHKKRARKIVRTNLASGNIVKPACCQSCGAAGVRLDAHHADYSKPLDIEWLCCACHGGRHRIDAPAIHAAEDERALARRSKRQESQP